MRLYSLFLAIIFILCSCSNTSAQKDVSDYFYFDTPITITTYKKQDEKLKDNLDKILKDYELTFSTYNKDALAYKLNVTGLVQANSDMIELTKKAIDTCKQSNGTLDITSGKLIDLWSINNENNIPSNSQIKDALNTIGCDNVIVSNDTVSLKDKNTQIDYGSITKGYVANKIEKLLLDNGYDSAIINLGGNVQLVGEKPKDTNYTVGVMKPEIENIANDNVLTINEKNLAVVTSGINQRFFVGDDGKLYHHILDLNTGKPADNNLASVTIITKDGYVADSLSTTTFIMGLEKGIDYIKTLDNVDAIFITKDKKIYSTNSNIKMNIIDNSYKLQK